MSWWTCGRRTDMPRRFNYTGRVRIRRDDVRVALVRNDDGSTAFDDELALASYGLPADAQIVVEAYRSGTAWIRFPFGTVGNPSKPTKTKLEGFDSPEAVLFRVKVTSPAERHGQLLAAADRIRP